MANARICDTALEAVAGVRDGATLLVHSFGPPQAWPTDCLLALVERGVKDLTVVCNTPAGGPTSVTVLAEKKQIRKLVCSYVSNPSFETPVAQQVRAGEIELEMVPQGTLVERVRAVAQQSDELIAALDEAGKRVADSTREAADAPREVSPPPVAPAPAGYGFEPTAPPYEPVPEPPPAAPVPSPYTPPAQPPPAYAPPQAPPK